jgi:hypothetical protein
MSRVSPGAAEAALAPETEKVFLHLLTIEVEGGAVLRFVDNNQNITSRGNEFYAAAFTVTLPEQAGDAPRPCRLAVDNTDLAVFQAIKQAAGRDVTATACVVMADTPDVYERGPLKYRLRNVRASKETVEGELYDFYLADRKFPKGSYSPEDFPGLFF